MAKIGMAMAKNIYCDAYNPTVLKTINLISIWDDSETQMINAKKLGISLNYSYALSKKYKLKYKELRHGAGGRHPNIIKISAYKILKKNGLTVAEIAKAFNCAKQNIQSGLLR